MESKKEIKPVLEYTAEESKQFFNEGDAVTCFADRKIYTGTIVAFSNYKENEDADPQCSVYLDTSKNNMNRSCEVIKLADITYMCRIPMNDFLDYPETNEDLDREAFINMFVGLGYPKETGENMYESIKGFMALYNIPLSIMLSSAVQDIKLNEDGSCQNELLEIDKKLLEAIAQLFQTITESMIKSIKDITVLQDDKK